MARLAEAEGNRRAEVRAALDWYSDEMAARAAATEAAETAVAEAAAAARRAAAIVSDVDDDAANLWEALRAHLGRGAGGRLGAVPEPAATVEGTPVSARHLRSAGDLIERARHPRPLPRWLYPVLPLVGAGCAAFVYLLAQGILMLGDVTSGGAGVAIAILGNVVVFLAPLSGLLAARHLTIREGSRFDGAVVGPTVVGGLVSVSALIIALH